MRTTLLKWMISTALCMLLCSIGASATMPAPLDDSQLSDVYAAGFDVRIDFDIDLAAKDPNSLIIAGDQIQRLQDYAQQQLSNASSLTASGARTASGFDAGGSFMPDLQNIQSITQNTLNITDNAMQNAQTLLNIIALNGDVAVGMNLNIIVNPGSTPVTITQTNINWSNLNISDLFPTLLTTPTQ